MNAQIPAAPWIEAAQPYFTACKTGLDTWLVLANATLHGAERMRMVQLATDVETQTENHRIAQGLAGVRDMSGLLALQSALARTYLDASARYWTAIAELTRETQAEIAQVLSARTGGLGNAWQAGMAAMPAAEAAEPERKAA